MNEVSSCPGSAAWNRLASGAAGEDEARSLREHLATCERCREAAGQTIDLGQTLSGPPPADAKESIDDIEEIGGYRVVRKVGQGGMGLVLEAEDVRLRRRVAIKVMRPSLAADAIARERFLREARAVAAVQHDHVVPIFHVGEDKGVPFLVMPLLPGESLEDRLKRIDRMPINEAVRIGREAATGLAAAHARGVVHRDVKPANIWLEDRGPGQPPRVRLLDFGLARGGPDEDTLTIEGMIVGTPAYMSPEQALGQPLDFKTDLYSLGAALFRMVVGAVPTATSAARDIDTAQDISPDLQRLLRQLLERDPSRRPDSANAVAVALERIERERDEPRSKWRLVLMAVIAFIVGTLIFLWIRGDLFKHAQSPPTSPFDQKPNPIIPDERPKEKSSPDVLAANWVRKHGGGIHLMVGDAEVVVRFDEPLPPMPIQLVGIEMAGNREFKNNELAVLEGLSQIDFITLDHSDINNEGMKHLDGLTSLTKLYLTNTRITDDGLKSLSGLTKLRVLRLGLNRIGDGGLAHLKGLTALEELWLDGTNVTNEGLQSLAGLERLSALQLLSTSVNDEGAAQFRKRRPECKVMIGTLDEELLKLRDR